MDTTRENLDHLDECFTLHNAKADCLEKLKAAGVRMSKQRLLIVDNLFTGRFSCTKELYYEVLAANPGIGISTVYRFLKVLMSLGVLSNNKKLDVSCNECMFRLGSVRDAGGRVVVPDGMDLQELLRLGLVVKGVIKSDEKIAVTMVDDSVHIEVKRKS